MSNPKRQPDRLKFTFKNQPRETGLAGCGRPYPNVDIKHDGLEVGYISAPTWKKSGWHIWIAVQTVVTNEDPCPFKWICSSGLESKEAAKTFLGEKASELLAGNTLHHFQKED